MHLPASLVSPTAPSRRRPPPQPAGSGEAGPAAPTAPAAGGAGWGAAGSELPPSSQQWDLTFLSVPLETAYRRWTGTRLVSADLRSGAAQCLLLVTLLAKLAWWRLLCTSQAWLVIAGVALVATPALPAALRPASWARRRQGWLAALRLVHAALFAVQLTHGPPRPRLPESTAPLLTTLSALVYSGAATMAMASIR